MENFNLNLDKIYNNSLNDKVDKLNKVIKFNKNSLIYNASPTIYPYIIKKIKQNYANSNLLVVFNKFEDAEDFYNNFLKIYKNIDIELFYPITLFPYEFNNIDLISNFYRIKTCNSLLSINKKIVVTSLYSLLFPVIDPMSLAQGKMIVRIGQKLDRDELIEKLIDLGFTKKNYITSIGDFTVKGELVSIYYDVLKNPVRIDFFDDKVETIKEFEKDSEKLLGIVDRISLLPLYEFSANEDDKKKIISSLYDANINSEELQNYILDIQNDKEYAILWNLDKITNKINFLTDYLKNNDIVCLVDKNEIFEAYEKELKSIIYSYNGLSIKGLTSYKKLFLDIKNSLLNSKFKYLNILERFNLKQNSYNNKYNSGNYENKNLKIIENHEENQINFYTKTPEKFKNRIEIFKKEYSTLLYHGYKIYIASLENGIKRFKLLFKDPRIHYIKEYLKSGVIFEDKKIAIYSENDILDIKIKSKTSNYKTEFLENKLDLKEGDFVVHIVHGIGQYLGIKKLEVLGEEKDFFHLKYKDNEDLYLPIENLGLIQKYVGFGTLKPKLDKLGGKTWKKTVEKTKKQIEDWARNLYSLYEERKKIKGIAFPEDDEEQIQFEKKFPYKETYDQYKAIRDVKLDMQQPYPMDRLICGDVGFGKTEVAIRAAFKAVNAGYQVILIAPTTILASQHFKRFKKRFEDYPVEIALLSRLVQPSKQNEVIEKVKNGNIDILIGTHRVLSKDVEFKKPGLLIIDEEQKFGVEAKEKIKFLRHNIDVLSLTATPIPRTLYMSLMKLMQISIINTPPEQRVPIQVYLEEFNDRVIKYAIEKEIARGGKVFFVHNRVETIDAMTNYLKTVTSYKYPITYAHGRMKKNRIKSIIEDFINGKYKVLVSTTIIESGIDIPDVDTIIIDRADRFGLSNLYQLKGRVGRRSKLAYAYLLYPSDMIISEIALKRLQIIADYSELGSGYKIALKDLELRGAGNILGKEQSGFISSVGFYMYQDLLKETVEKLQRGDKKKRFRTEIELDIDTKVNDKYFESKESKIDLYEKLYDLSSEKDLKNLYDETVEKIKLKNISLSDKKNLSKKSNLPEGLENLFYLNRIRIIAEKKKISKILEEKEDILIIFDSSKIEIKLNKIVTLLKNKTIKIDPDKKDTIFIKNKFISNIEKLEFIEKIIKEIF